LVGVDIFIHWTGTNPNDLAEKVKTILTSGIELSMITNRGIKVWPDGFSETFCTDHWRCRFKPVEGSEISNAKIIELLNNALNVNLDTIKTENLYSFDGKSAYSLGQGQ
jgi:isocitrate dehydrogenase